MKRTLLSFALFLPGLFVLAQGNTAQQDATIAVRPGTTLTLPANHTMTGDAALIVEGELHLNGDLLNNTAGVGFVPGTPGGSLVLTGTGTQTLGGTGTSIELPCTLRTEDPLTLLGKPVKLTAQGALQLTGATQLELNGKMLTVENASPNAISGTGSIRSAGVNNSSTVRWTMALDSAYTIPYGSALNTAVPLVITPDDPAPGRTVSVVTYPTLATNLPLPPGVTNTTGPLGGNIAPSMVDRYWRITSSAPMIGDVRFSFGPAEDAAVGIDQLRPVRWGASNWVKTGPTQSNPAVREVLVHHASLPSGVAVTFALARDQAVDASLKLDLRVLLDGPLDPGTGQMNAALRTLPSFPLTEPFTALGYVHTGGGGGEIITDPDVLAVNGADAIVDWVVVELRDANAPATVLGSRSALVRSDGDVVLADGITAINWNLPAGNYHVAVLHRNHLGVMTALPVAMTNVVQSLDVSAPATTMFGTDARKTVGAVRSLWSGDANFDGIVKYTGTTNDRDPVLNVLGGQLPTATLNGYRSEDLNLDGTVKYTGPANDRDVILQNIGGVVPTLTRAAQLP